MQCLHFAIGAERLYCMCFAAIFIYVYKYLRNLYALIKLAREDNLFQYSKHFAGFESTSSVSIGGSICNVIGTPTYDTLTCITTAGPLGPHEVQVTTAGVTVSTAAQYTYENPVASVTAVSATNLLIGGLFFVFFSRHPRMYSMLFILYRIQVFLA